MNVFAQPIEWSDVLKASEITPTIQSHLRNVYVTLAAGVFAAAVGSYVNMTTGLGSQWAMLAAFVALIGLAMTPKNDSKRLPLFGAFCVLEGMSLGRLLNYAIDIDPHIVTVALLGTGTVFTCFTLAALLAKRRAYLYLGGVLSSALSWMLMLSFINMFWRMEGMANLSLYGGLLIFSGYIVFDTQLMVEKAARGSADVIDDALNMFLNLVNIFVRLVAILAKDKKKK